jgi:hypothetical protein
MGVGDDMGDDMPHPDDMHDDDDMGLGDDDLGMGDDGPPIHNDKIGKLPMKKKKPKLGAHHHLMAAMKDHPALMGGM